MGAEIELVSVAGGEVMIGSEDDKTGLRVGAVEDACDGGRLVEIAAVAELVVTAVEDACDGGRLVDSVAVAELVVMAVEDACDGGRLVDSAAVVMADTEVVADEVAVPESLISSVKQLRMVYYLRFHLTLRQKNKHYGVIPPKATPLQEGNNSAINIFHDFT